MTVARLLTVVDVRDVDPDPSRMSLSALHEAVLEDGRIVVLLEDRGWTSELRGARPAAGYDIWALTSIEEIESTARVVVGPDEPFAGRSHAEMEEDHWAYLAGILRQQGVAVDAAVLKELSHDVVLSERLLAYVDRPRET